MTDEPTDVTVRERLDALNLVFRPSAPVHTQELLAGRTDQLFALLEVAETTGASAAVFGERGVGKTSVASVHARHIEHQGRTAYRLNCSAMDSFSSLWRAVAEEAGGEAAGGAIASTTTKGHLTQHDVIRMLKELSKTVGPVVIIFDEFDVVADAGVGEDMANLMKAISDQGLDAHIVVVGVAEDVDVILAGHASVGRNLRQIRMPRLSDEEIGAIVIRGLSAVALDIEDEVVERVVRLAQGLPHYAHLLGKSLGRRGVLDGDAQVGKGHWLPALEDALDQTEQAITDLHAVAVTTAKPSMLPRLLLACALAPKDAQGYFRPIDAGRVLEKLEERTLEMASYTGNLANLTKPERGAVLQSREFGDGRKRYRFTNPLLQPYTLMRAVREGLITDDDLTDRSLWEGGSA